jgi:hypothetical protein
MREAGLEDLKDQLPDAGQIRKELNFEELKKEKDRMEKEISSGLSDWTTPPLTINTPEKPPTASTQTIEPTEAISQTIEPQPVENQEETKNTEQD